jgi:hypothetical protein
MFYNDIMETQKQKPRGILAMYFNKPIKMPRGSHYGSNYWEVFSKKMGRKACFFSNLEYHNFLTLEMDPNVVQMCEQPVEIEIMIDGKNEKSILDYWLKYADGSEEIQEVKSVESLKEDSEDYARTKAQIHKQKLWCEENDIRYTVRSEAEIYTGEYLVENCAYMASRVRRYKLPAETWTYEKVLIEYLEERKKADIRMLIESGRLPLGNEMNFLCYMHYKGAIRMEIDNRPLDYRTEVALVGRKKI